MFIGRYGNGSNSLALGHLQRCTTLLVVAFGSPGGDHCIWDLERLIEYGRGDDAVGSKVSDVVAQFAPRADERRLDVNKRRQMAG